MKFLFFEIIFDKFIPVGYIEWQGPYLYINSGRWYRCHVPSTFATVNTHSKVFFVFLPGGISKEWGQIVSANCVKDETGPIVPMFTGLLGTPGRPQK